MQSAYSAKALASGAGNFIDTAVAGIKGISDTNKANAKKSDLMKFLEALNAPEMNGVNSQTIMKDMEINNPDRPITDWNKVIGEQPSNFVMSDQSPSPLANQSAYSEPYGSDKPETVTRKEPTKVMLDDDQKIMKTVAFMIKNDMIDSKDGLTNVVSFLGANSKNKKEEAKTLQEQGFKSDESQKQRDWEGKQKDLDRANRLMFETEKNALILKVNNRKNAGTPYTLKDAYDDRNQLLNTMKNTIFMTPAAEAELNSALEITNEEINKMTGKKKPLAGVKPPTGW
jgi:hypothetical protein